MNTAMRCAAHMRMRMAHMRSARETATVSLRPGVLSPQIFTTRSLSSPVEQGEPKDVVGQPTSKSTVWSDKFFVHPDRTPTGFKMRASPAVSSLPASDQPGKVDVFLETWEAGSAEPPHSHPGDDMTVVVEGHMRIQFFKADDKGKLTRSGTPVDLTAGQTCLIEALRIHDAKYITACKLVYVHNSAYGCYNWASKRGDPRLGYPCTRSIARKEVRRDEHSHHASCEKDHQDDAATNRRT